MIRRLLPLYIAFCIFAAFARADMIAFGGRITQSAQDGTGPAVNNPDLNNIMDGDAYTVTLDFAGSISSTGTHQLPAATFTFLDAAAGANEARFVP